MRIDPADGAIYLTHSPHPIREGASAESLYKLGILKGVYALRQQETVSGVIGSQSASLDLMFVDGVFKYAHLFLAETLPSDYESLRALYEQAARDFGFSQSQYGWRLGVQPQQAEMWIEVYYTA